MVRELGGHGPAVVGKFGEALVGEGGVEEVAVGGDVAGRGVGEEDGWLLFRQYRVHTLDVLRK